MEKPKKKTLPRNSGRQQAGPSLPLPGPQLAPQRWWISQHRRQRKSPERRRAPGTGAEWREQGHCLHLQGRWPSAQICWATGGEEDEHAGCCHLPLATRAGALGGVCQGSQRVTVNKGLSLREKSRLQAALRPQRGPGRQAQSQEAPFPPLGRVPFRCGEEQLRDPGRSSRAGQRAPQGGRGAARTEWRGGGITAPPRHLPGDGDLNAGAGRAGGRVCAGCYATVR